MFRPAGLLATQIAPTDTAYTVLHARTMDVCLLRQDGEVVLHRNMQASPDVLLKAIAPYRDQIVIATVFDRQTFLTGPGSGADEPHAALDDHGLSLACGALIISLRQGTRRST